MSFIKRKQKEFAFGIIVGSRDVFPDYLAKKFRQEIIDVVKELGYDHVILGENETKFGVVEIYEEAKKCDSLFKENDIRILF